MTFIRRYFPYFILAVVLFFAFFWRLDGAYLWRDEATTACWAREMAVSNSVVPKVWNGKQLIVQGSKGHDFNEHFLPSMQGWLQFYVGAITFKLLGASTFTARFPFALLGIIGIYLFYLIFRQLFDSKRTAAIAAFLSIFSLPYLHFVRQSRYYALVLVLTLAIIYEIIKHLRNPEKHNSILFFIRLGILGILLFFTNYFTFGIFWVGLILVIPLIRNKRFTFGLIGSTLAVVALAIPVIVIVHASFLSRAEILSTVYLSDYWDWFKLSYGRINPLFPMIPFLGIGVFLLWRYPEQTASLKRITLGLWILILSTMIVSVIINKSNAFLRYMLHVIPIAVLLIGIYTYWVYKIFGNKAAWIFFAFIFVYHSLSSVLNHSEAVVKRQFAKNDSYNRPLVEFLRENVKPSEKVAFIINDKGMVAYFYLPDLRWVGILEAFNPYNQVYKTKLPETMFDDYFDIDWVVVWGVRGLPARVEIGYDLMWNYCYGKNRPQEKVDTKLFVPKQYTITQAEASITEDLKYYDFYRKIKASKG